MIGYQQTTHGDLIEQIKENINKFSKNSFGTNRFKKLLVYLKRIYHICIVNNNQINNQQNLNELSKLCYNTLNDLSSNPLVFQVLSKFKTNHIEIQSSVKQTLVKQQINLKCSDIQHFLKKVCLNCCSVVHKTIQFSCLCCKIPTLITSPSEIYHDEFPQIIASMANEGIGSVIICKKFINNKIEGLQNFHIIQSTNLSQAFKNSLQKVQNGNKIQARFQLVKISDTISSQEQQIVIKNASKSNQFIIRILIWTNLIKPNQRIFYVQNKVENFKPTQQFYSLHNFDQSYSFKPKLYNLNNLNQLKEQKIYKLINYSCKKHSRQKNILEKCQSLVINEQAISKIQIKKLNLNPNMQKKSTNQKPNYIFYKNTTQVLKNIINNFQEHKFEQEFIYQLTQQYKIQGKVANLLRRFQKQLIEQKFEYKEFKPISDFQQALNHHRKKQSSTYSSYTTFIIGVKVENLSQKKKKEEIKMIEQIIKKQQNVNIIIEVALNNIQIGTMMNQTQIQNLELLLKNKFKTNSKIKKKILNIQKHQKQQIFKQVQFCFDSSNLVASVYIYFLLFLSKKRPKWAI